jgi:aromatic ring-opening dioxygenase LigB subunit
MLVFAAIAPHGDDILEEIAPDPSVMAKTRAAMEELSKRFIASRPDTVIVLTPHGHALTAGAISVGVNPTAMGGLRKGGREVASTYLTDQVLAQAIAITAIGRGIPVLPVYLRDKHEDNSPFPLDWGAFIPLWYTAQRMAPKPHVVVMAPDRKLPRETLVQCGEAIARAAEQSGKRVALLASCDQGHAHDPNGRYGYHPASAEHDAWMCEAIIENDLFCLMEWREDFLETAKVDAFWQTIILVGALKHTPMHGELLSYEAPTYFGMAVATYKPVAR